jgi:hypothetical protein
MIVITQGLVRGDHDTLYAQLVGDELLALEKKWKLI